MATNENAGWACPKPVSRETHIQMAHGGGGTLMQRLIDDVFLQTFNDPSLQQHVDASVLKLASANIAFTTDSFVVDPLEFPGGDIGSLAVHGTVNDLCMSGAKPQFISAGFILEEGLDISLLKRVVASMKQAADACQVRIVTGDTKVVDRGKGDGIFINTAGIGLVPSGTNISPQAIEPGDCVLVSGDIGRHGIAIMSVRDGLAFEGNVESDSCGLVDVVQALIDGHVPLHCLRDLTRGGLSSALNELAQVSGYSIRLDEESIPVRDGVHSACEMLGLDPLYVACEGRFVAFLPPAEADHALALLHEYPEAANARIVGQVDEKRDALVTMTNRIGTSRIVDMLSGEQLPRIC